ncbi:hypothetical protein TVAG_157310 [Trichomonas vaginalis G3]|uniref:RING-type domain-containing protein n=1 Tax=Trichomonas vaginalis (strain ATCC PRA-98 / G3) TaxID=412133 RepID=A2E9K3_TRIV3|nr:ubiquitin-protein transferase protein [Trichomonas vaginalis G3]EAY10654.1 hypothetical protein TVAG_157310 [Trichomonas vaginalis G3]KAI5512207.1 ubiquitin-protein transferase protein [Trichomonas vaginalis G3]|eukprot:XP_001322877.1 hypothetical protein [Trichomonas vaginalis G3]
MTTKAWCYNCEKSIVPTDAGLCPICNTDFIEYGDSEFNADPQPAPAQPAPSRPNPHPRRVVRRVIVSPFNFFGGLPGMGGNGNQPNGLADMFNNILEGIFGRIGGDNQNGDGRQMGDFFFGNEEQWQALADRLFRLNQQSLGSPPTADDFLSSDSMKPVKYTPGCCAENVCSICLEEFNENDEVVILPCKHGFHEPCLQPWLKMHSECPSCRHKLPTKD